MVRLRASLLAALVLAGSCQVVQAEAPKGTSKTLKIGFQVEGGDGWCRPEVKVTLTGAETASFTRRFESFQQMLGRIRAGPMATCDEAVAITYSGYVQGELVSLGESPRVTNWIYVPIQIGGITDICRGPDEIDLCKARWVAYRAARKLFSSNGFEDVRFSRFLDTTDGPDLVWQTESVKGRAGVRNLDGLEPSADDLENFVNSQSQGAAQGCKGSAKPLAHASGATFSYKSLVCDVAGVAYSRHILAFVEDGWLVVLGADTADGRADDGQQLFDKIVTKFIN